MIREKREIRDRREIKDGRMDSERQERWRGCHSKYIYRNIDPLLLSSLLSLSLSLYKAKPIGQRRSEGQGNRSMLCPEIAVCSPSTDVY